MADLDREQALRKAAALLKQESDPGMRYSAKVLDLAAKALQVTKNITDDGATCTSAYGRIWTYLRHGTPPSG